MKPFGTIQDKKNQSLVVVDSESLDQLHKKIDTLQKQVAGQNFDHGRRYVRSRELSKILGLSESSLQNLRISGILPFKKIQGTILYSLEEVYAAIEKNSYNQK